LIHKYTTAGALVEEFSISGVSGLRDLAYDGEYFYGGAAGGTIWQMNFTNKTLINTISGSFQSRAIAYDNNLDVFYCSNWGDPVYVVNRTGGVVDSFNLSIATSNYGFAYDDVTDGGPYLWVFDQSGDLIDGSIYQWNLTAGAFTSFYYNAAADMGDGTGIAGGLFTTLDYASGKFCIGGLLQNSPTGDYIFVYEYEPDPVYVSDEDSAFVHCVDIGDMYPPVIADVTLTPSDPLDHVIGWEIISATVTDDVAVATVQANITYPDASIQIVAMSLVGGDTYACNTTLTLPCDYTFHVYATDTSAKDAESAPQGFFMPYNEDVNSDGTVHFMDLVAVSLEYNDVGPDGWVRTDVNNDGAVHFMDLVAISLNYNTACP
jgi:hypothetical protein